MNELIGFKRHNLPDGNFLWLGELPSSLRLTPPAFEELWSIQPLTSQTIRMYGRTIEIPRKQQAYGRDYHFSGQTSQAAVIPPSLTNFLTWAREIIDGRLNGLLVNWYDGSLGHYIGQHRDSRANLVKNSPIVTISHGHERVFRLHPWKSSSQSRHDFQAKDGTVFVMPYETNLAWTHGVPASVGCSGRRISVTLRSFLEDKA